MGIFFFFLFSLFYFQRVGDLFGGKSLGVGSFRPPYESKMTSSSLVAIFATRCKRTLTAVCKRGACAAAASTRRVAISIFFFIFAGPSFIVVSRQTQRAGAEEIRRNRDGDEARPASLLSLFLAAGPRKVSWTDGKSKRDVDVIPLPIYLYHSHNGPSQKRANKKKNTKSVQ